MSAVNPDNLTSTEKRARLVDSVKSAIVAQVLAGATQTATAEQFGISRQWVAELVARCRNSGANDQKDWRKRLADELPTKCVDALDRSVSDTDDPHKAASTGLSVLKGLGHLAGDNASVSVNVVVTTINSLPPDIRDCYLSNDDVIEVTPECDKDNTSTLHTVADNSDT